MTVWKSMSLRKLLLAGTALLSPVAASALNAQVPPSPAEEAAGAEVLVGDEFTEDEIVVVGTRARGSVIGDIPPEDTLDSRDIRATGATDITELLEALEPQLGSARGRSGGRPITLLNGQRISGFREIRDIPTEAIQRVEILPEEVALKYGYRADQKVVNIVLRPRFRSTVARLEGSMPTEGGTVGGEADLTRLMINEGSRTTLDLDVETNSALTEAERDIRLEPDPDSRALDPRPVRTLLGSRTQVEATATHNRTILGDVSATVNGELAHSQGQSLLGYPTLADGSPIVSETDARARNTYSDSAHAGLALNWDKSDWRYSVTGNADIARDITRTDPDEMDPGIDFRRDRSRSTRMSGDLDATVNGDLFALPAGDVSTTLRAGVSTFHLDSTRQRGEDLSKTDLGRSLVGGGANLDVPISRRNRDFSALGNLTLNANGEVQRLSDFGTLTTIGAGANWSPVNPLSFILSWTREEGAPSVQQLGDPLLETSDFRIFDFTRGETVLVNAITGGNAGLEADRRNVLKIGGNWRVLDEDPELRLRAEYVRSRLDSPISSFPGPSAALEEAFPERFVRDEDGQLVGVDLRPVNFESARRDTIRWGFDFTKQLRSARPSAAQIAQRRARRAPGGEGAPGATDGTAPAAPEAEARPRGGRGGGRFGGGGRQGGRLNLSLTHIVNLVDEVTIRPGLPELDYLNGDALGSTGGRSRHEVQARAGWSNNGLGARASANWRSGTRVESAAAGSLRFSPLATFDLRLFANLGERFDLVSKHPWLRGTQVRFEVNNLFNARPRVRDADGDIPFSYQSDLLDPRGRVVSFSIRKLFLPPRGTFRRAAATD